MKAVFLVSMVRGGHCGFSFSRVLEVPIELRAEIQPMISFLRATAQDFECSEAIAQFFALFSTTNPAPLVVPWHLRDASWREKRTSGTDHQLQACHSAARALPAHSDRDAHCH